MEELDEFVGEAGEVDVGEVVGTELVPCETIVGEDDVRCGFEDDEAETVETRRDQFKVRRIERITTTNLKTSASFP